MIFIRKKPHFLFLKPHFSVLSEFFAITENFNNNNKWKTVNEGEQNKKKNEGEYCNLNLIHS